jgi:hypothetical protein
MQWEYTVLTLGANPPSAFSSTSGEFDALELTRRMNELGRQGWELASAFDTNRLRGATQEIVLFFKRPTASHSR